jgi:hypothetical protein
MVCRAPAKCPEVALFGRPGTDAAMSAVVGRANEGRTLIDFMTRFGHRYPLSKQKAPASRLALQSADHAVNVTKYKGLVPLYPRK